MAITVLTEISFAVTEMTDDYELRKVKIANALAHLQQNSFEMSFHLYFFPREEHFCLLLTILHGILPFRGFNLVRIIQPLVRLYFCPCDE